MTTTENVESMNDEGIAVTMNVSGIKANKSDSDSFIESDFATDYQGVFVNPFSRKKIHSAEFERLHGKEGFLPCPFCGSEPVIDHVTSVNGISVSKYFIRCGDQTEYFCLLSRIDSAFYFSSEKVAAEVWNNRAVSVKE